MANLGQETGGTPEENRDEARKLIELIVLLDYESLPDRDLHFFEDMRNRLVFPKCTVSGKQLFYLRDIKDKLL
jgi:hypothetical protein